MIGSFKMLKINAINEGDEGIPSSFRMSVNVA